MSASILKKIGVALIVLMVFFVYLRINDYRAKHFKVSAKTFHVQTSKTVLLNTEFSVYQLLASANHFHIMMSDNVNVPIINMRRTLHIEKSWIEGGFIYVLYSIDLLNSDKSLTDVPKFSFNKLQLHLKDGKTIKIKTMNNPPIQPLPTRLTYGHRVYNEKFISFQLDPQTLNASNRQDYLSILNKIDKVTILDPTLEASDRKKTMLSPITFPAQLNQDKYYVGSTPINKELKVKGATIHFNSVKKYFDHNELHYLVTNNKNQLLSVQVRIQPQNKQFQQNFYSTNLDLANQTAYVANLSGNVQITPENVLYKQNKPIKFTITQEEFKSLLKNNNEIKVADLPNGHVYFGFDRSSNPEAFYIGLKNDSTTGPKLTSISVLPKDQVKQMQLPSGSHPNFATISLSSMEGKTIHLSRSNNYYSSSMNDEMKSFFNMINLDTFSKGFVVNLDGLFYQESIKAHPITLTIK